MLKFTTAGLTALIVTASPLAYAQAPSQTPSQPMSPSQTQTMSPPLFNTAGASSLTDARLSAVKSALQLTSEQEKYWPGIEDAVRARAKDRQARIANIAERVDELRSRSPGETLQNLDPVNLMQRRADALAQRATSLRRVADAWKPLYQTLSPDQKLRMAFLTISTLHQVRNAIEQPGMQFGDSDDEMTW